jgi:hypothetical protein
MTATRVLTSMATPGTLVAMRRANPLGTFLAALALVAQLALGSVAPDPEQALALHDAAIICHAPPPGHAKLPPAQHHRVPIGQFCPLWTALTAPHPLLPSAVSSPHVPAVMAWHRPGLPPPAIAPPAAPYPSAQPRAPPILA